MINQGEDADPVFNDTVLLQNGSKDLKVTSTACPVAVDWNRDGRKDLIVGNTDGSLKYFENRGFDDSPIFDGSSSLSAGGKKINVQIYSRPTIADWNRDGVNDIICGCLEDSPKRSGKVLYFQARGPLSLSGNRILSSERTVINLRLNAGKENAGRNFTIIGSLHGTLPGTHLPGGQAVLPVNIDFFSYLAWSLVNTSVFQNFRGRLDENGMATAVFDTQAPVKDAAGIVVSFACALDTPWDFASNGVNIEIVE